MIRSRTEKGKIAERKRIKDREERGEEGRNEWRRRGKDKVEHV